jgi:hypothetical protein
MAELKDSTINGNPVWHSGNDGTGSGLDADTLDGQHGSYYYSPGNPPPSGVIRLDATTIANLDPNATAGTLAYVTDGGGQIYYKNSTSWELVTSRIGTSSVNPAFSPSDILINNPGAADGAYWYTNGSVTYRAYTRFNWHEGGHWILVLKVHNRGDMPSGSSNWTNSAVFNESDFNLTSGTWAKYNSWNNYSFTRVLLEMNTVVPAIQIYNTPRTMFNAMQNNSSASFGGLGADSRNPSYGVSQRYDNSGFYFFGGPFAAQTGNEPIIQQYGINCFANVSSNGNPDNAGFASVGRAGARVGAPMDEGSYTPNGTSNSGADSGFGFGGCAGNSPRTWSCGYGEWSSTAVVNTLPGYLWVR